MIFKLPPVFTNTCQTRSPEKRVIAIFPSNLPATGIHP
jgi:hypothetical protein